MEAVRGLTQVFSTHDTTGNIVQQTFHQLMVDAEGECKHFIGLKLMIVSFGILLDVFQAAF